MISFFLGPLYLPWSDIMACLGCCSLSLSNAFTVLFCFFYMVSIHKLTSEILDIYSVGYLPQQKSKAFNKIHPPPHFIHCLISLDPSSALKPGLRCLSWCSCCKVHVSLIPAQHMFIFLNSAQFFFLESFLDLRCFPSEFFFFQFFLSVLYTIVVLVTLCLIITWGSECSLTLFGP